MKDAKNHGWLIAAIVIAGLLIALGIVAAAAISATNRAIPTPTTVVIPGPPTTVVVPSAPTHVGGPVGTDLDRALFRDLANLPAGQEEAGLAAAQAWCGKVASTDGRIDQHGDVFDDYPDLNGYSGKDLIRAAVTVFCPQYTDHLPTGR